MGFTQAAVLSSACFVLGILFVCFTVDHKLLFTAYTDQSIEDGFLFYTTFYNAPPAIRTLLHSMVGVGLAGLIGKLHTWTESAMFFDGSSLAAYIFAVALYLSVTIPSLRTIVNPLEGVDTREDRIEAMRILAAGNVIIMLLLGGMLLLQGGQEYARRVEERELAKTSAKASDTMPSAEKKEQ
ncbi:hypothetical protein SCHPADRAFT_865628 [Schizopora paradoxa]|uniref:Shr3 amino acid permease chaperone n=1 Tax=Schizopora paradoxa TaxID=27342 RepID=A0A0H2SBF4_9AGAM|nr:hypothetical protein SCHPADRAFT_865628 [Schizopora paradoxa]